MRLAMHFPSRPVGPVPRPHTATNTSTSTSIPTSTNTNTHHRDDTRPPLPRAEDPPRTVLAHVRLTCGILRLPLLPLHRPGGAAATPERPTPTERARSCVVGAAGGESGGERGDMESAPALPLESRWPAEGPMVKLPDCAMGLGPDLGGSRCAQGSQTLPRSGEESRRICFESPRAWPQAEQRRKHVVVTAHLHSGSARETTLRREDNISE